MKPRMFVLMKSQMSLKMGYLGSKTKSLGQILEIGQDASEPQLALVKPRKDMNYVNCGRDMTEILLKAVQNTIQSIKSEKKHCVRSRLHIISPIIIKLGQNVCLEKISDEIETGHVGFKTRSLGQILEKTSCTF